MDDQTFDLGREAITVQDLPATDADTQSLLSELSGMFDDFGPPNPPKPPADIPPDPPAEPPAVAAADTQAVAPEETPVISPPRIEPPAMIWKPSRRVRFRFRR